MKVIAEELIKRQLSFAGPITLPLRFYDFATNAMVDHPSRTTLSLAAFKAIVNPDSSHTPVMKQFASQVIVEYYTNWEEYYRSELATLHDCSKYDFRIDYFGDLGKMRHDYVHNRGVCSNSAHCALLKWFSKGDLMIPTSENTQIRPHRDRELEIRRLPAFWGPAAAVLWFAYTTPLACMSAIASGL